MSFLQKADNDQCRSQYNNRVQRDHERKIQLVNHHIRKNRCILCHLCPEGKATVRKDILDAMGYNYNRFSHLYKSKNQLYYFSYDFGFTPIDQNGIAKVLIVKHQDYMDKFSLDPWSYLKTQNS